jgi:hypothetical protein
MIQKPLTKRCWHLKVFKHTEPQSNPVYLRPLMVSSTYTIQCCTYVKSHYGIFPQYAVRQMWLVYNAINRLFHTSHKLPTEILKFHARYFTNFHLILLFSSKLKYLKNAYDKFLYNIIEYILSKRVSLLYITEHFGHETRIQILSWD